VRAAGGSNGCRTRLRAHGNGSAAYAGMGDADMSQPPGAGTAPTGPPPGGGRSTGGGMTTGGGGAAQVTGGGQPETWRQIIEQLCPQARLCGNGGRDLRPDGAAAACSSRQRRGRYPAGSPCLATGQDATGLQASGRSAGSWVVAGSRYGSPVPKEGETLDSAYTLPVSTERHERGLIAESREQGMSAGIPSGRARWLGPPSTP